VLESELRQSVANDLLHLVMMPTEACNFRCTYCYEDFRLARMLPEVVRGVEHFLSRRAPDLRGLEISWFGGEPLLAFDIVEEVSVHVRDLQVAYPTLAVKAGMTTNAYTMSRTRFERLLDLGITHYQIAFDGPRGWHDRKRILANGHGTFDRIWANVLSMRDVERPFEVLVRLHVDRENEAALPEFIRDYAAAFGTDDRFQLFIRTLACLGGPQDATLPVFSPEAGGVAVRRLSDLARDLGVRHVTIEQHAPVCYAARGNSYVVRADGRLNKCTVALEHPNNQVGRIGADGRLDLEVTKMRNWMRGLWSGDREELECPMRGYADPPAAQALPLLRSPVRIAAELSTHTPTSL